MATHPVKTKSVSNVVVDTNVVSYLLKGDTRAALYRDYLQDIVSISFMTVAEMYRWADTAQWGIRKQRELQTFLRAYVVLWSDDGTCRLWARIRTECARQGRPISVQDAWIAACAVRVNAPLVTHNRKDFDAVSGLQIISEND